MAAAKSFAWAGHVIRLVELVSHVKLTLEDLRSAPGEPNFRVFHEQSMTVLGYIYYPPHDRSLGCGWIDGLFVKLGMPRSKAQKTAGELRYHLQECNVHIHGGIATVQAVLFLTTLVGNLRSLLLKGKPLVAAKQFSRALAASIDGDALLLPDVIMADWLQDRNHDHEAEILRAEPPIRKRKLKLG